MEKRVAAVVVTYNRLSLLKICLEALNNQERACEAVIIVNNGSTDGTKDWLDTRQDIIAIHQENLGGAGGFHRGMQEAYALGYDWIWVMDDDGYPHREALMKLLRFPIGGPCILNALVLSTESESRLAFSLRVNEKHVSEREELSKLPAIYGDINPFNGTLIAREIITRVGLPRPDMFIWGDETEFCTRVVKNGFPLITVTDSLFYHPKAKEKIDGDWEYEMIWRKYFGMRNLSLIIRNKKSRFYKLYYTKYMAYEFMDVVRYQKTRRLTKFLMVWEAYLDAMLNDFSKRPADIKSIRRLTKEQSGTRGVPPVPVVESC